MNGPLDGDETAANKRSDAVLDAKRKATGTLGTEMSNDPVPVEHVEHLELPVEELLRRGRPFPPREEMVIDDLTPEEGEALLEAVRS